MLSLVLSLLEVTMVVVSCILVFAFMAVLVTYLYCWFKGHLGEREIERQKNEFWREFNEHMEAQKYIKRTK